MMEFTYSCRDNDAIINFLEVDGIIDEVWIKAHDMETCWIVIGFEDFQLGAGLAGRKFEKFKKKRKR